MMGVSWRVGGRGEFSTCNTTLQASRGRLSLCPSLWWTPGLTRGCVFLCVVLVGAEGSTTTTASVNNVGRSFIERVVNMAAALVLPQGREGVS